MRVYRISRPEYVATALLGNGAALAPGRWNSRGVRLAYTASSVSLAMLEILVHVNREDVPEGRRMLAYEIPDAALAELPPNRWPRGWDKLPYSDAVRRVGDGFVRDGRQLALRVPSAVARGEFNVLVNPAHPQFGQIRLLADDPLALDPRLFGG
ncbi:MAG: RES family NAD+ phosphorylase [Pseudoxanthomonas sp.]|nr:RES family NAD+ phosphorylase [Pseudoxanthomonas sp.]MDZ3799830.1 RES family NAD+ phosphorylase [Xanthomonadales bacterium]TXI25517.1 MAG: RES domain-containing protein [Ottowia sp.]MBP8741388.1 RES family NAD+ phosphorylase [Pseudoxanthomonas sp.]MBP8803341.1 RES family NAD+ phosphorylase [Pseudoxanthomonas sp.]